MRRPRFDRGIWSCAVVLAIVSAACGTRAPDAAGGTRGTGPTGATSGPGEVRARDYDPSLFDETSAVVDNPYFPLVPGTRFVWKGRAFSDEGERVDRKVIFIVTDFTKVIDGVEAVVGWDRDFNDGWMGESELVFYAQDMQGNVWHLGELVEHWQEDNELDGARSWFKDSPAGARPGIQMLAQPVVGAQYPQGFAPPPWFWQDRARVAAVGVRDCVPVGCFDDTIVTEEFEPRFPGEIQLKHFAAGIGGIRVGWTGHDEEREVMVLASYGRLGPAAMERMRARVLAQEERAYAYSRTEPMAPRSDTA